MNAPNQQSIEWWKSSLMFNSFGHYARKKLLLKLLDDFIEHFETADNLDASQAAELVRRWLVRNKNHFEQRSGGTLTFDSRFLEDAAAHFAKRQ